MGNKIPPAKNPIRPARSGPSNKNVVTSGRREGSPVGKANSLMNRGKLKGPGVKGR